MRTLLRILTIVTVVVAGTAAASQAEACGFRRCRACMNASTNSFGATNFAFTNSTSAVPQGTVYLVTSSAPATNFSAGTPTANTQLAGGELVNILLRALVCPTICGSSGGLTGGLGGGGLGGGLGGLGAIIQAPQAAPQSSCTMQADIEDLKTRIAKLEQAQTPTKAKQAPKADDAKPATIADIRSLLDARLEPIETRIRELEKEAGKSAAPPIKEAPEAAPAKAAPASTK